MEINILFLSCACSLFVCGVFCFSRPTAVTFVDNSFRGVLVAIQSDVQRDLRLIDYIKDMFTDASTYMYTATAQRAYFGDITILVPSTWADAPGWTPATSELFNSADVVIQVSRHGGSSHPKKAQEAGAYTQSYGRCGQPGVRINIFTDVFGPDGETVYGPAGRLLVHEWAHFRWGVFDEFPEDGGPQFYFSPNKLRLEAVRCNINMAGTIIRVDPVSGREEPCQSLDQVTGTYNQSCVFIPHISGHYNDNITASIMDRQNIPSIINFCNDNQSDSSRVHNYESPSSHNRLCGSRSTWSVISESPDFQGGRNLARDVPDTTPRFKVVRMSSTRRMVLAIDTSASMEAHNKLTRAIQAATYFIEDGLEDGVLLGVVAFSNVATVVSPITELGDEGSRKAVSRSLPRTCEGETSIAAALLTSIELLKRHNDSASDAFIVLITDGLETIAPKVDDIMERVMDAGAAISVIAFDNSEERSLEKLSSQTGGRYFLDTRQEMSTSAVAAMLEVYRLFHPENDQLPVQILGQSRYLMHLMTMSGTFTLDATLGRHTVMIITYTTDAPPDITVTSPSGRRYCSLYPEYINEPLLRRVRIIIPGLAEVGRWSYAVTNNNVDGTPTMVSVVILSSGRDPTVPALSFTGDIFIENSSWPIKSIVVAEVTRGGVAAKDLKVKATVHRPMASLETLELFDNGAGADAFKGDGIYSRFFTRFSVSGQYSVSIDMMNTHGDAIVAGDMDSGPSQIATGYASTVYIEHPKLASHVSANSLALDEYPPMRITDLRVLHTSSGNRTVVLAWTAPGDDLDDDRASSYTIVMGSSVEAIIRDKDLPVIDPSYVTKGSLDSPKSFGDKEEVELTVKESQGRKARMVFAVFAVDDSGNKGELSNLVTVGFGYVPDVNTLEYMQEARQGHDLDMKAVPQGLKVVIACVGGLAAGLLVVTVFVTAVIQSLMARNKEKLLLRHFHEFRTNNSIV